MCRKPAVTINPSESIWPCSSALVATVVPWARLTTSCAVAPADARIAATPRTRPTAGFDGVLATLVTCIAPVPVSTATMSVKVPPVSMPMRKRDFAACAIRFYSSPSMARQRVAEAGVAAAGQADRSARGRHVGDGRAHVGGAVIREEPGRQAFHIGHVVAHEGGGGLDHLGLDRSLVDLDQDPFLHDDLAVDQHGADGLGIDGIGELLDRLVQRDEAVVLAVEQHEIGLPADLDDADLIGKPARAGGADGGHLEGLLRSHPGLVVHVADAVDEG